MITEDQFSKIIDRMSYAPKQKDVVEALNIGMKEADINTPLRTSMFVAQVLFETGGLKWFVELGTREYFVRYKGRTDLGNTEKGDEYKFRGRGLLQITGRFNYGEAGEALGLDLISFPDLAAELIPGARIAGWFWKKYHLNFPSDTRDIKKVTRVINGGYNGLQERINWYKKAREVLEA